MRTLRFRIALGYIALIVVTMGTLGGVLLETEARRFRRELDGRLLAEARLVAEAVAPSLRAGGDIAAVDPLAKRLSAHSGVRVTVIGPDGTVLGESERDPRAMENHASRPEVRDALAAGAGGEGRATRPGDTTNADSRYVAVPVVDDGRVLGVARVARPVEGINTDLRRIALDIGLAALAAALAAAALAVVVAGAVTRPLNRLRHAVRMLATGGFDYRVTTGGDAEVADLAGAFNEMAERLRETVTSLAQQRSRLEALLAASADAVVAIDADGVVRYLNPAAVALLGAAEGRPLVETARHHELSEVVRVALAGGSRVSATIYLDRRDTWVQATASPIAGGGGWAVLLLLHDITGVRRAEITRRDFVANVSHELRTPLAGIKAVVETLRDGALYDPPAAVDFLTRVDEEVDRLVQLVEELLQLARIESGAELELTDLAPAETLAACVERFRHMAERAGVTLALDVPESLPHIRADPARLGQAVGNLVHNALKFTPPGGAVTVTALPVDGALRIAVTDTGTGIAPADLPRIFERFYVADRARGRASHSTGLGLAIVKHIVRAHGGTVEAQSTPGEGATFTITLPAHPPDKG